eukprot:SM000141S00889  [mRNA]  locus=s141:328598:330230:+ [translate_table: standard]
MNSPVSEAPWNCYLEDEQHIDNLVGIWNGLDGAASGSGGDAVKAEDGSHDEEVEKESSVSKKRSRDECCREGGSGSKANREKMRRDRLNDRFVELSQVLELDPGRPPKTDKASILSDAVKVVGQLRTEAKELRAGNAQLQDQIKELKAEKIDLRDEKARLKSEKDRLEQQVKSMAVSPGFISHPAAMQAAAAAYAAQGKGAPYAGYPAMHMWQYLPPADLDTSQDHVLRPPVA